MAGLRIAILYKHRQSGRWILPQLEELRRRDHQVMVVLPPGPGPLPAELARRGFEVVESPFDFRFRPNLATLRGLWRLRRLLRDLRLDILKYHLYASALAARFTSVGLRLGRVHVVVGPLFLESRLIRTVERWLWRADDVIICGTDYTSRQYGALGAPPERRPSTTPGIDTGHFSRERFVAEQRFRARPSATTSQTETDQRVVAAGQHVVAQQRTGGQRPGTAGPAPEGPTAAELRAKIRAELGIAEDAFVVVMVAYVYAPKRLTYHGRGIKGHDILLPAWQAFQARHPRAHLLLIGGGFSATGETHRRELVRRFGVDADPSITWLESVTEVRPYYNAADLSVSPSLSEGHGAPVEAGAMSLPSIVSDAGGLPEVVDETSGWVVPAGQAGPLEAALGAAYREFDAGVLTRRGDAARERMVKFFDHQPAAEMIADIVERTANGVRSR
ncbi:glycosyltransferase family 4 protein [Micromonospora sp. NPDC049523]|uniref:glycosyltransferase family 4 protein n=1 Tax=Micromonospora sp. NPDC049523 TaxID=3155921 RepID=UPI003425AB35